MDQKRTHCFLQKLLQAVKHGGGGATMWACCELLKKEELFSELGGKTGMFLSRPDLNLKIKQIF